MSSHPILESGGATPLYRRRWFAAVAAVATFVIGLGVVALLNHGRLGEDPWLVPIVAAASSGLLLLEARLPVVSAVGILVLNLASPAGVPALMCTLFLKGMLASYRRLLWVLLATVAVTVVQDLVWVIAADPRRDAGELAIILFVETLTISLATASGLMVGRIRVNRDEAREQLRYVSGIHERERETLAAQLHDRIGHELALVSIYAQTIQEALRSTGSQRRGDGDVLLEAAQKISRELEQIITVLIDPSHPALTPLPDLATQVERFELHAARLRMKVHVSGPLEEAAILPDGQEDPIRATFDELLSNVLKHGGAGDVAISSHADRDGYTVEVINPLSAHPSRATSTRQGLSRLHSTSVASGIELTTRVDNGQFIAQLHMTANRAR